MELKSLEKSLSAQGQTAPGPSGDIVILRWLRNTSDSHSLSTRFAVVHRRRRRTTIFSKSELMMNQDDVRIRNRNVLFLEIIDATYSRSE